MPRWLALAASVAGTILGLATNLYSAEFRRAIEESTHQLDPVIVAAALAAMVSSGTTVLIYGWLWRRRERIQVVRQEMVIGADAVRQDAGQDDHVAGRSLRYLEATRSTEQLVVFLHGLGLDANDFRPYMIESRFHCVALTEFGFNAEERDDDHYRPISLASHVRLIAWALRRLREANPNKRMTLVGFSYGADMILFLTRFAPDVFAELAIDQVLLLDPNVNRRSTTISSKIATVDPDRPLTQLINILTSATDDGEFRYLCEYLYKIMSKNFAQIQQHARDVVHVWSSESYDRFLDYLGQLNGRVKGVHVVLSYSHEGLFNPVASAAAARGLDTENLECSRRDHFELIDPAFLKDRLEGML